MTMTEVIAMACTISLIGQSWAFSSNSRNWKPMVRNSTPSISQMTKSQKKMPCRRVAEEISSGPFQLT